MESTKTHIIKMTANTIWADIYKNLEGEPQDTKADIISQVVLEKLENYKLGISEKEIKPLISQVITDNEIQNQASYLWTKELSKLPRQEQIQLITDTLWEKQKILSAINHETKLETTKDHISEIVKNFIRTKFIVEKLRQPNQDPEIKYTDALPNENSSTPLPQPPESSKSADDKAAGKKEEKSAIDALKKAPPVISNATPKDVRSQVNGDGKGSTKMDLTELLSYMKEPNPSFSQGTQSSSSQPIKEHSLSNTVEPALKDDWYNKHWVNYEKVPEMLEDSEKLNSIIERLNKLQGRTEIKGQPELKIRDSELLLFTRYACFRLETLKGKLNKGTPLSYSEKNEFRMMADFTKNRRKQLKDMRKGGLNGSQFKELTLLIEKRQEVRAPSVKVKANPTPVDFYTKFPDEKNEPDEIDAELVRAITNAKKNETAQTGKIEEKARTAKKVDFKETALKIDIDVTEEKSIPKESELPLNPSHEPLKQRRQSSSASPRGFGF